MRADSFQQRLCFIAIVNILLQLSRQRCISFQPQPAQRNQHQPAKRNNNKTHISSFVRRVMADGSRCSWFPCKDSLFARQRCINSHAQTQRTLSACSSNKNGPAACAAGCLQDQTIQRWETARTAPRETCPCSCRTNTACATACEWKKNELLHHSLCYMVALLLCVLLRAV